MFISLIGVGFLHGFILLPYALAWLGLECNNNKVDDDKKESLVMSNEDK